MPLFMDVHRKVQGLTAETAARAHQGALDVASRFGVRHLRYWFNEIEGTVFCLIEAPSAEAAERAHREAHGWAGDEMILVREGI